MGDLTPVSLEAGVRPVFYPEKESVEEVFYI